ncbi:MAG: ATP-binding protein [Methanobacteriota archaeon]|nr:MAG: ATP-binding protein [Euryarchaeota archaeon]
MQVYLLDYQASARDYEAPVQITQTGISEGIGIRPSHFLQYMKPLLADNMVEERSSRVKGGKRRRKVYSLTDDGILAATDLRNVFLEVEIKYFDLDGRVSKGKISDVVDSLGDVSLVQLSDELSTSEVLDPTTLRRRLLEPEVRPVDFSRTSPRPERFCGREIEKKRLLDLIRSGKTIVLQGIAGIGKTALASKICASLKKERSVFWFEFRKWHSEWGLLTELSRFLEAVGRRSLSKHIKAESTMDAGRLGSVLGQDFMGIRAVLFFDDFQMANPEIIKLFSVLLNITKSNRDLAVVVLTREIIPFYDRKDVEVDREVEEIHLLGLDKMASKELVGEGVEEFGIFEEVYSATQGHPLFLDLIRTVPAIGPEPRLRYIDRFIEEEIYSELDPEEKKMMKVASIYENPVQTSLLFFDESLDIDTFLKLKKRTLIGTLEDGRVQVHEMIRKPFLSMLTPQEKERFHLWAAENLLREEDWILQIEAVHHLLVSGDHAWGARVLAERGEELIEAGYSEELLFLLMEFDPRSLGVEEGAILSEREGDILRRKGHIDDALMKLEESKTLYEKSRNSKGSGRAGRKLASIYKSIGKLDEALKIYTKSLSAIGKDSKSMEAARIYGGIGSVMARKGRFEKAVEYLLKDLAIAKEEGNRKEMAKVYNQLGYVFYETGAYDRALEFQRLSLETKEKVLEEWKKYFEL